MGFFRFFRSNKEDQSAKVAKDRLQVLIAHERTGRDGPDYLPMLKQDILDVIKKYVAVGDDALSVQLETQDDCDVLELNITLPEDSAAASNPSSDAKRRAVSRRQAAKLT
ncbi:MAG: cell division topological specificity factor MinE [Granulosicoccus sp.]|nr:cell division topological specificity factor MinE [Granulosicoccus sp.]